MYKAPMGPVPHHANAWPPIAYIYITSVYLATLVALFHPNPPRLVSAEDAVSVGNASYFVVADLVAPPLAATRGTGQPAVLTLGADYSDGRDLTAPPIAALQGVAESSVLISGADLQFGYALVGPGISVQPPPAAPAPVPADAEVIAAPLASSPGDPSIVLYGTRTTTRVGEPSLFDLSIINSITQPQMTVQLILQIPSGWSVQGVGFAQNCTGQCSGVYPVDAGANRNVQIEIQPNQVGGFAVQGRVIWFFGSDKDKAKNAIVSLPITVRTSGTLDNPPTTTTNPLRTPITTPTERPGPCGGGTSNSLALELGGLTTLVLGLVWMGRRRKP